HAVGIAGEHVGRPLAGAYLDHGAVRAGKGWNRAIGTRPEQDDVAARQLEEALDVGGVFGALGAFPRHQPVEAELTAPTDGAHGTYVRHRSAFLRCRRTMAAAFDVGRVCRVRAASSSASRATRRTEAQAPLSELPPDLLVPTPGNAAQPPPR